MYDKEQIAKYLAVPVAVLAVSTAAILIRFSEANPIAISFYRMFFSCLIFLFPFLNNLNNFYSVKKREFAYSILSGAFLAFHFAFWIYSLNLTSIASSVVLVSSHPLIVLFISDHFLGESIDKKSYFSVILALFGVFIILLGDLSFRDWSVLGDFFALIGMLFLAGYLSIGKVVRKKASTVFYVFVAYFVASLVLGVLSFVFETTFKIYGLNEYLIFISLAVVPTFLGHSIYNWSLRYVRADFVSISLLGEPVLSSFLAIIFFSEIPPLLTVFGAIITLFGVYLSLIWR